MKNERGITLIALIMIMVVLIILAGISVLIMLTGEKKAEQPATNYYVDDTMNTEIPEDIDEMDIFKGLDNKVENPGNGEILLTEDSGVVDGQANQNDASAVEGQTVDLNTASVGDGNTVDTNSVSGQQ